MQPPITSDRKSMILHTCIEGDSVDSVYKQWLQKSNFTRALSIHDLGVVDRQIDRWKQCASSVRPFYAVKCNPDDLIIQTLLRKECGFDCATKQEIEKVLHNGADPNDIILANPVKSIPDLQYARKTGVRLMTFDNAEEVWKIKAHFPEAELVLRLRPDDSGSLMRFGNKFGASIENVPGLLRLCQQLNISAVGVSFHIGSGCFDTAMYEKAIILCRQAFDIAEELGLRFRLLDIGGGFPGNATPWAHIDGVPSFEEFAEVIEHSIAQYFPKNIYPNLTCISEPGRYFATACSTLIALIQGKREISTSESCTTSMETPQKFLYYINDGVYGSFNSIIFDHAKPIPISAREYFQDSSCQIPSHESLNITSTEHSCITPKMTGNFSTKSHSGKQLALSTFFGPTCDSMDVIVKDFLLPELHVGEHIIFENMGAYTYAAASNFNGCPKPSQIYIYSDNDKSILL